MSHSKAGMSHRSPISDFALLVAAGVFPGITGVNKFGRNSNIAIGVEEEIWEGSAAYPFATGADITKINTTVDIANMRGEVVQIQGLDVNWVLTVQLATLDASNSTTLVTLDTPLRRVFRMKFRSAVVGTSSITLVNDADTVLYASIEPGTNQTEMAIYTVPAGFTAYMTNYFSHVNPGTNLDPTAMPIRLWETHNDAGYAPQLRHTIGQVEGNWQHEFNPYLPFGEMSDIFITAQPVGKAADVSAGFDLYLLDNSIYGGLDHNES